MNTRLFFYILFLLLQLGNVALASDSPKIEIVSSQIVLSCKGFIDVTSKDEKMFLSGPINNNRPDSNYVNYFSYPHGRLYYRTCHQNFGELGEKSFGFVEWESKNRKTKTRVTLLQHSGYCFRGSSFEIIERKLIVSLSTCDDKNIKSGKNIAVMTYRWVGSKSGKGNFKLEGLKYKKDF